MTKADIIIQNAAVYTVDDENPTADAVAIADNADRRQNARH